MKLLIALLALTAMPIHASDVFVTAGKGTRAGAFNASVGWMPVKLNAGAFGLEVEYTDCGEQPEPLPNINRMLALNVIGRAQFSPSVSAYGKVGMHTTRYSYNGTNDYEHDREPTGWNVSVGLDTPLGKHLHLAGQVTVFDYRQVSGVNHGGYVHPSIGLRYQF